MLMVISFHVSNHTLWMKTQASRGMPPAPECLHFFKLCFKFHVMVFLLCQLEVGQCCPFTEVSCSDSKGLI